MKKYRLIFFGILAGFLLSPVLLWIGTATSALAAHNQALVGQTPVAPASSAPWKIQSVAAGDETQPPVMPLGTDSTSVLPTQIPGENLVYFTTTDSDATATVLFLLNTDSVAHIVALRGYNYNGVLVYSLNINVPATSLVRLVSDSIAAAPPPSWSTPAPIVTNFTDFTYYASLSLPKGVKAQGYTLFNPGTGTVDPRADQGAIPLGFATELSSLFVPLVTK